MNKTIKVSNVTWEMLILLSKKERKTPDQFIANVINTLYNGK